MKSVIVTIALLACAAANAQCYGSGSFQRCTDSSGNTYNVNRAGGSTYMSGSNADTGSTWSQQTHRSGSSSSTYGRDSEGNSWSSNTYRTPSGSTTTTRDSSGNTTTRTCNQFGCF